MRNWEALALAGALTFAGAACTTYKTAAKLSLVALTDERGEGKSLGHVLAEDCATQVFGYGRPVSDIDPEKALARGRSKTNVRYVKNMSIDTSRTQILVYSRTCVNVTGMGYR